MLEFLRADDAIGDDDNARADSNLELQYGIFLCDGTVMAASDTDTA